MPTVTELQLFAVDLPFKVAFRHAAATRTSSESLFLRVRLDSGVEGWGECLPRAYVSGERREEAFALLRDAALPALLGRTVGSLAEVISFLEKCDGKAPPEWVRAGVPQSSAWCSVDLALLDAFGRASGEPLRLGAAGGGTAAATASAHCRYSGVASAGRGWRDMVSLLKLRAFRFPHVKLKLERDGAIQAARTARRLLGRRVDLRVDANMAWEVEQALAVIGELRRMGIQSFEQPIAANDLPGLARLVRESSAGIVVDGTIPRLVFLMEFDDEVADHDGSALVDRLDAALRAQNDEYQAKRKSLRYGAPIIRVVRSGEFDRYRRRMVETGQRADGQFKVLRLTSDTSFAAEFEAEREYALPPQG